MQRTACCCCCPDIDERSITPLAVDSCIAQTFEFGEVDHVFMTGTPLRSISCLITFDLKLTAVKSFRCNGGGGWGGGLSVASSLVQAARWIDVSRTPCSCPCNLLLPFGHVWSLVRVHRPGFGVWWW